MPQTLQIWSPVSIAVPAMNPSTMAVANRIKSFLSNPDGGYTAVWDQGFASFSNTTAAVSFSAFGAAVGAQQNGTNTTGFVEWGGGIDEVMRSGSNIFFTYNVFQISGLSPGGATLLSGGHLVIAGSGVPIVSNLFSFGTAVFGTASNPTSSNYSIDTSNLGTNRVVSVVTSDQIAGTFTSGTVAAIAPRVTATIRDAAGIVTGVTLSTPGGPVVREAAVTGFADGSFLGLWSQDGADGSGFGIRAQRASGAATLLGANFTINQNTVGSQDQAHAVAMPDGNAFIAWRDASGTLGDASGTSIKGRIVTSAGTFATAEFRINQTTTGSQSNPYVVALNVNQVLVVWNDLSTGANEIHGVVMDLTGAAVSDELLIATGADATDANGFTGTLLSDGRVVVGWSVGTAFLAASSRQTIIDPRPDVIFGTAAGELILGRGNLGTEPQLTETIVAGGGNDTIWGFAGADQLYGEAGEDTIYGGAGNDTINGGADNDTLWGELYTTDTGNDTILGGGGNDVIFGQNGNDQLHGEDGEDTLLGGEGDDTLFGGADKDSLHGEGGNDTALGGGGADAIWGYDGTDVLYGEAGADVLLGGAGSDTLDGGTEQDALYGEGGNDILIGGAGDDFVFGMDDDDVLYGDAGIDTLLGGDGADTLFGGTDGDALYGEAGSDQIYGGSGNDFIFTGTGSDVVHIEVGAGIDQIYDFDANGADLIRFAAGSGAASFASLGIFDGGSYTVVVYNAGTQAIYLWGTPFAQVGAADFAFG